MPSAFDDAWQDGAVLDDHFGEEFVIVPPTVVPADVNAPARPMIIGIAMLIPGMPRRVKTS